MMDIWRQQRVVLLLLILGLSPSSYALKTRPKPEQMPWDSMHITKAAIKRDAMACPTNYSSCPSSLHGGCCPTDKSCGTDSCFATTTAPASACSKSGYVACGIDQGGGCCPGGYSCANDGCIPLSGAIDTQTCGTGSFSCAASLGGGCCKNNYACGAGNICYQTSFSSVSLTETITTTDSNAHTITITTSYLTAYRETYTPTSSAVPPSAAVAKVTADPTSVPKVAPTSSPTSGLTSGQLGGIIAAAVIILITVLLAAYLIIRRLNAVVRVQKAATAGSGKGNSGSGTKSHSSDRHKPHRVRGSAIENDYDTLSIDPLMMVPGDRTKISEYGRVSRPFAVHENSNSNRSELDSHSSAVTAAAAADSPPILESHGHPFSLNLNSASGYQQVPSTEPNYFDTASALQSHTRNHSMDSYSHMRTHSVDSEGNHSLTVSPHIGTYSGRTSGGYFDPFTPDLRDQNLRFGHPPPNRPVHGRQFSDTSDVSAASGSSPGDIELQVVELDGGLVGAEREEQLRHGSVGSMASVMQQMGLLRSKNRSSLEGRRWSSDSTAGVGRRGSGTQQAGPGVYLSQAQRLDRVQEASNIVLDKMTGDPAMTEDALVACQEDVDPLSK